MDSFLTGHNIFRSTKLLKHNIHMIINKHSKMTMMKNRRLYSNFSSDYKSEHYEIINLAIKLRGHVQCEVRSRNPH